MMTTLQKKRKEQKKTEFLLTLNEMHMFCWYRIFRSVFDADLNLLFQTETLTINIVNEIHAGVFSHAFLSIVMKLNCFSFAFIKHSLLKFFLVSRENKNFSHCNRFSVKSHQMILFEVDFGKIDFFSLSIAVSPISLVLFLINLIWCWRTLFFINNW